MSAELIVRLLDATRRRLMIVAELEMDLLDPQYTLHRMQRFARIHKRLMRALDRRLES